MEGRARVIIGKSKLEPQTSYLEELGSKINSEGLSGVIWKKMCVAVEITESDSRQRE